MKLITPIFLIAVIFFFANCTDNKTSATKDQSANSSSTENKTEQNSSSGTGNGIVGSWLMYLDAFDKNENKILDDDERKQAVPNKYRMQLNADGTCRLQDVFTGTYTVTEETGIKILKVQRKKIESEETQDPLPDIYHIKSLTKDELILLTTEAGSTVTFWIFKREK
jgi:hypothetical protein